MDSRSNNTEPRRIKFPRHLEPIDPNQISHLKNIKALNKPKDGGKKRSSSLERGNKNETQHQGQQKRYSDGKLPTNYNCCAKLTCDCEPGDLDDWLNEAEKRHENVSKYVDPYQWTGIKELPDITGLKDEVKYLNDNVSEDEDNGILSKGVDLIVVGVQVKSKEKLDDINELRMDGSIANLRVTRTGLAFEVFNEGVHSQKVESQRLVSLPPVKQKSKKCITAEQLAIKQRKAEQRRKACLAERVSHFKVVLGQYKDRAKQLEKIDQERHENKMKAIENRINQANDRRRNFNSRNYERCRRKNCRIIELLEKRKNAFDLLQAADTQLHNLAKRHDCNDKREERNMKAAAHMFRAKNQLVYHKPRCYEVSPKRKSEDDFELNFVNCPSPSLSILSAAGDANESSCHGDT